MARSRVIDTRLTHKYTLGAYLVPELHAKSIFVETITRTPVKPKKHYTLEQQLEYVAKLLIFNFCKRNEIKREMKDLTLLYLNSKVVINDLVRLNNWYDNPKIESRPQIGASKNDEWKMSKQSEKKLHQYNHSCLKMEIESLKQEMTNLIFQYHQLQKRLSKLRTDCINLEEREYKLRCSIEHKEDMRKENECEQRYCKHEKQIAWYESLKQAEIQSKRAITERLDVAKRERELAIYEKVNQSTIQIVRYVFIIQEIVNHILSFLDRQMIRLSINRILHKFVRTYPLFTITFPSNCQKIQKKSFENTFLLIYSRFRIKPELLKTLIDQNGYFVLNRFVIDIIYSAICNNDIDFLIEIYPYVKITDIIHYRDLPRKQYLFSNEINCLRYDIADNILNHCDQKEDSPSFPNYFSNFTMKEFRKFILDGCIINNVVLLMIILYGGIHIYNNFLNKMGEIFQIAHQQDLLEDHDCVYFDLKHLRNTTKWHDITNEVVNAYCQQGIHIKLKSIIELRKQNSYIYIKHINNICLI